MEKKLHEFENLVFRIRKLENEKIRTKNKYRRLNMRIHRLNAKKAKLKKQILEVETCK